MAVDVDDKPDIDTHTGAHGAIPGYDRKNGGLDAYNNEFGYPGASNRDNVVGNEQSPKDDKSALGEKSAVSNASGGMSLGGAAKASQIKGVGRSALLKRLLVSLGLGGGVAGIFLMMPALTIGQLSSVTGKMFQGPNSVQAVRSHSWLYNKLFGGAGNAVDCSKLTYKCKITSMSEDEIKKLKQGGFEVIDKNGKPLKVGENGRFSGGVSIRDIETGDIIKARDVSTVHVTNTKLANALTSIYPGRIAFLRDGISNRWFGRANMSRNAKVTAGTEDPNNPTGRAKNIAKNISDVEAHPNVASQADGEISEAVQDAVKAEQTNIKAGTPRSGASTIADVMKLPEPNIKIGTAIKNEAIGAAQGWGSLLTFACTGLQRSTTVVRIARGIGMMAAAALFAQYISTIGRVMSNDPNIDHNELNRDVDALMIGLGRPDADGNTFSDSATYHELMDEQVSLLPVTSPITGGALLTILTAFVMGARTIKIGSVNLVNSCGAILSPGGQATMAFGGLAITTVIAIFTAGIGALASGASVATIKAAAKGALESLTKKISKDSIKAALKANGRQLAIKAGVVGGILLAGYLVDLFIVPYIAKLAAGSVVGLDSSGPAIMDTVLLGGATTALTIGLMRGFSTMSKSRALAFQDFSDNVEKEYAAYRRKTSNPFDLSNPYSIAGSVGIEATPALAKLNIFAHPELIASLPGNIMSALTSPMTNTSSTAYAATVEQRLKLMEECQDVDIIQGRDIATYGNCVPMVGFADTNMLQNVNQSMVNDYMLANKQVDDQGMPVPDSEYAKFRLKCIDGVEEKSVSQAVDTATMIDNQCFDQAYNDQENIKYYRLMAMDKAIDDGMASTGNAALPSGTCPAGAAVAPGITQGYWNGGYQNATFCMIDNTTDLSMNGLVDSNVFKANNDILQTNVTGKIVMLDKATADMVELVKRYGKNFSATFSYRSHNLQCIMYYYAHNLSTLPSPCTAIPIDRANQMKSQMGGHYVMPGNFYTSKHESGTAMDVSDLGWINQCAAGNYDGNDPRYKPGTCFNFVSEAIPNDERHVAWKGQ